VAYQDTGINEAGAVSSGGTKSDRDNGEMLATMRSRLTMAISAYSDSREDELDDLRFRAASPDNQWQWPADVLATRGSVQGQTINARPVPDHQQAAAACAASDQRPAAEPAIGQGDTC
jgi:hypothetical protein